ncbi:MAG: nitroreductase family protein [Planctomycetota bacterium]|nr:nitroreductase family protein [Planctomycetota bacterium]
MTEKPAETAYPLHDLLRRRWSPRAFSSTPIEREKLGSLLEAARWAASSRNLQPWRFLLVEASDAEAFEKLAGTLMDANQAWARKAPLLILVCAQRSPDGGLARHAFHDCGLAVAHLTMQALSMDLWVHQMAGFSAEKARAEFGVPADFEPVSVLAVGYYGNPADLPENRRATETGPRTRKPLGEIAFRGTWGSAAEL